MTIGIEDLAALVQEHLSELANEPAAAVRLSISAQGGEVWFASFDAAADPSAGYFDSWSYYGLSDLLATRARVAAYARAIGRVLVEAKVGDRLAELVPHLALLALPELVTADDFYNARYDVAMEERAVERLREERSARIDTGSAE